MEGTTLLESHQLPECFYGDTLRLWLFDRIRQSLPHEFTVNECAAHLMQLRGIAMERKAEAGFKDRLRGALSRAEKVNMLTSRQADVEPGQTPHYIYTNLTHTNHH
jgi:hypothetical protein